ncbi:MAG TPA: SprT family zinc-dependent metalloprotease [Steroidobacteraceae bacterium]|nr:SprT family zinc-dependent metalloprotease [Steroidobacteraceae bacterium]
MNQLFLWSDTEAQPWVVRESRRARRLAVRVHRTGRVEVVVPPRTSQAMVSAFLSEHRDWIETRRLAALRQRPPETPFPPPRIALPGVYESWRVHLAGGTGRVRIREPQEKEQPGEELLVVCGEIGAPQRLKEALRRWLMGRAQLVLADHLADCAREFGFSYRSLSIRRQRTRWGSCSVRGTISLNCCILFQPPEVLRYLLIHELAHTRHMNHSRAFWECVAGCCPDYRQLDRQLLDGWRRVPSWLS